MPPPIPLPTLATAPPPPMPALRCPGQNGERRERWREIEIIKRGHGR